jgi:Restriction endonuclease XhoI
MALNLANFDLQARDAIKLFWGNRDSALEKQKLAGREDAGARGAVTAGKNMDGFVTLVRDLVVGNGLTHAHMMLQRRVLSLPGYFRPTKLWDVLIVNEGRLVAALEFKSQVGPSFGNNTNNRAEEAIGTAVDLRTAYREGAFGKEAPKPFVGWLMLLEDAPESRCAVKDNSPHFPVFPEFKNASYAQRYEILFRKLVQEQLYSSAAVLLSPKSAVTTGEYTCPGELTNLKSFVTQFAAHIAAEAARQKC